MNIQTVIEHLTKAAEELKEGTQSKLLIEIGDFEHDIQMIVIQDNDVLIVAEVNDGTIDHSDNDVVEGEITLDIENEETVVNQNEP